MLSNLDDRQGHWSFHSEESANAGRARPAIYGAGPPGLPGASRRQTTEIPAGTGPADRRGEPAVPCRAKPGKPPFGGQNPGTEKGAAAALPAADRARPLARRTAARPSRHPSTPRAEPGVAGGVWAAQAGRRAV